MSSASESHLSRIVTRWTVLRKAHGASDAAAVARIEFFERYQDAVVRYLYAVLRDGDAVEQVFSDFALRFLEGRFQGATAEKGRFRDYLKASLVRLAADYHRRRRHAASLPGDDVLEADGPGEPQFVLDDEERRFESAVRESLMERAWHALESRCRAENSPAYAVLAYRAAHPEATSEEMAAAVSAQLNREPPYTAAAVRKALERARSEFADLLFDEVLADLQIGDVDRIEQHLIELELLDYCRSAMARWRNKMQ